MKLKELFVLIGIAVTSVLISCGDVVLAEEIDPDAQLATDIGLIEDYLAEQGYTDYDTLDSEVRMVILEVGTGQAIEYSDIVFYDYLGNFIDTIMFDTSIEPLAIAQDQMFAIDTVFLKSELNELLDSLDDEGNRIIESVNYSGDYISIWSEFRQYNEFVTTHTPDGWFIQQDNFVGGFRDAVHYAMDNAPVGSRVLGLMPSREGYGPSGLRDPRSFDYIIQPNTPLMFEIVLNRVK